MSFLSSIAKILTDRERVKKNQISKDKIKEVLRSKNSFRPYGADEEKKVTFVKKGNVLLPEKFNNRRLLEQLTDHRDEFSKEQNDLLDKLLKKGDWIDEEGAKKLVRRYEDEKNLLEDMIEKAHDEPYVGQIHNVMWRTKKDPAEKMPMPRHVSDIKGVLGKDVPHGGSDPFAWLDVTYSISKKLLKRNYDKPLVIQTRSDLIAHDDYIAVLNPSLHKIKIHVLSGDDRFTRMLEPGAPSYKRRLSAAKKLKDLGYDVTIVQDLLEHPDLPKELKQLLFKPVARGPYRIKVNHVKISDESLEHMLKATGIQTEVG